MRSILRTAVVVAASLLLVPQFVAAADLDVEIQDMKQRLEAMESQIQAQSAELTDARAMVAEQQSQIDQTQAVVNDERDAVSALSSFLESTDISGFAAAGWNYVDPDGDLDNDESNEFNLNQAWLTINKAATADSRAGFNLEFAMGNMALTTGSNYEPGLFAASVSYLAPLGNGLMVDAGILATALGAEVEALNGNWQINRGVVWALQPVTNTGATAKYSLTDNISVMAGILNDPFSDGRTDDDSSMGLTSQVSYSQDKFGLNVGFNYGGGDGSLGAVCEKILGLGSGDCDTLSDTIGADRSGIIDVVATLDATENLSVWANYDYSYTDSKTADLWSIQAIALAGRLAVMDGTGISGRFEYADFSVDGGSADIQTYTVTVDHELTAGLNAKLEYGYETLSVDGVPGDASASVINAQLLYEF